MRNFISKTNFSLIKNKINKCRDSKTIILSFCFSVFSFFFTFSFFFINNPYLFPFYIFHSVVTRSLFFLFSFENHRFRSAAALLPNLHSVVMIFVVVSLYVVSSCFCAYPAKQAFSPERRKKCGPRRFIDFVFRQTNRLGGKARRSLPPIPYPFPYFHFSLSTPFFFRFFFLLCQKLKTWSFFSLYSLEMLSTLSLAFICWLLVLRFEGFPSKPLHQSWLTAPFRLNYGSCYNENS